MSPPLPPPSSSAAGDPSSGSRSAQPPKHGGHLNLPALPNKAMASQQPPSLQPPQVQPRSAASLAHAHTSLPPVRLKVSAYRGQQEIAIQPDKVPASAAATPVKAEALASSIKPVLRRRFLKGAQRRLQKKQAAIYAPVRESKPKAVIPAPEHTPHKAPLYPRLRKKRQLVNLPRRRREKQFHVFRERVRFLLRLCFVGLCGVSISLLLLSPVWIVQADQVKQHTVASWIDPQPANELAQRVVGKPIYQISSASLLRELKRHYPFADTVAVQREAFPASLHFTVEASNAPWAVVYAGSYYALKKKMTSDANKIKVLKADPAFLVLPDYSLLPMAPETGAEPAPINRGGLERLPGLQRLWLSPRWIESQHPEPALDDKVQEPSKQTGPEKSGQLTATPLMAYNKALPQDTLGRQLQRLHALLRLIEHLAQQKVVATSITSEGRVLVQLPELGLDIGKLDATVFKRAARLKSVLASLKQRSLEPAWVDLRWDIPVYMRFAEGKLPPVSMDATAAQSTEVFVRENGEEPETAADTTE